MKDSILRWDRNIAPFQPSPPCWFYPDRMEHIHHDAKPDENIVVLTSKYESVCGRVVENAKDTKVFILGPQWVMDKWNVGQKALTK